jgi:hypothetical protein
MIRATKYSSYTYFDIYKYKEKVYNVIKYLSVTKKYVRNV